MFLLYAIIPLIAVDELRCLDKKPCPTVLNEHHDIWLGEYLIDRANDTKKYRYRHKTIKETLKGETGWKCVYCESKIGHNSPGDVEHKIPSSADPTQHFTWDNLTVACTECNRRKNDYYHETIAFLDPYQDDVENAVEHHGPLVLWRAGCTRAEVTIKRLDLHNDKRHGLIMRKIEKINEFCTLIERWNSEKNMVLRTILWEEIEEKTSRTAEYSGMLLAIVSARVQGDTVEENSS